jgi:hypothetical protein
MSRMTLRPTTAVGFSGDAIADSEIVKHLRLMLPEGGRIWRFPRHDAAQDAMHTASDARVRKKTLTKRMTYPSSSATHLRAFQRSRMRSMPVFMRL